MKQFFGIVALAGFIPLAVMAQEDATSEGGEGAAPAAEEKVRYFSTLPKVEAADGQVEVQLPGQSEWADAEIARHYPLGATFRTAANGKLTLSFGKNSAVTLKGNSCVSSKVQPIDELSRTLILVEGTIQVKLPGNMKPGYFVVSTPGFLVKNLSGESRYHREFKGDGDDVRVKCVSGTMTIEGRHFSLPDMRSQNEVRIRTEKDNLFTAIYGVSGDYFAKLDRGLYDVRNIENGTIDIEHKFLDWKVAPLTVVRINRVTPALGERMSVAIKTFDAAGELKNDWAFVEGRFEVNTGEIAPMSKERKAELEKKMNEVSEATAEGDAADASTTSESGSDADDI